MSEFHLHPDGFIYVRTPEMLYTDTIANFLDDLVTSKYSNDQQTELVFMPEGASDHVYSQDIRHCYAGGGNIIAGGPMPWPIGDQIISSVDKLLATQAARRAQEEKAREDERAAIEAEIETKRTYADRRAREYPPLSALADALYWQSKGDQSKMDAYLAKVEDVKVKYPKSESGKE